MLADPNGCRAEAYLRLANGALSLSAALRAQADALDIEAQVKRRLADEYDAAQARGEVQTAGRDRVSKVSKENNAPTAADVGLSRKEIHEARQIRDVEKRDSGIGRRTVDAALMAGKEPKKAAVCKTTAKAATENAETSNLSPSDIPRAARRDCLEVLRRSTLQPSGLSRSIPPM
ncbi:hypothetical protein XH98_14145 [Bradyrhizobium sp. CCBAU 51745]|nr:hypothetical protein [Bradyrhizobium sp. CCBAU 51745]